MKYKVGDRVRIKSLDWYNENKDEYGDIDINYDFIFYADRSKYCGKVFTISEVFDNCYSVKEDNDEYYWIDEMIEGLVKEEMKSEDGLLDEYEELTDRAFKGGYEKCKSDIELNGFQLPEGYIFKDDNGNEILTSKIILEKKKKEYPKTYEECCKVLCLGEDSRLYTKGYKASLIQNFQKLIICRDAYWRIAGAEMGLGKPWEPDDADYITGRYCIFVHRGNIICSTPAEDCPLTFPTEEMRDAFYENFKEEIEQCKELL